MGPLRNIALHHRRWIKAETTTDLQGRRVYVFQMTAHYCLKVKKYTVLALHGPAELGAWNRPNRMKIGRG